MIRLLRPISGLVLLAAIAAIGWFAFEDLRIRVLARAFGFPNVSWPISTPNEAGLNPGALERLWDSLHAKQTHALLIARGGQLVFERYAEGHGPNLRQATAALAKALTGIPRSWSAFRMGA